MLLAGRENVDEENSGFDSESTAIIHLSNDTVLYMREVTEHLALVCVLRADNFEKQGFSLHLSLSVCLLWLFESEFIF